MNNTMSIAFTGDIGFDKYMTGRWNDENLLDEKILSFLHSADHVVANVEGAMMDLKDFHGSSDKGIFFHVMNPGATIFLNRIKADYWNICNNHSMDAGAEGLASTRRYAALNNAIPFGADQNAALAAKPVYFEEAGGIGMFAIGYQNDCEPAGENKAGNFSWNDFSLIEKTIKEIKKNCRWCLLIIHGGEEFCNMPLPPIRNRYLKYLDMGADLIIAHHPHVTQPYEKFENGKMIFYSLGNFVFDTDYQRAQFNSDKGVLLKLNLFEDSYSYEVLGTQLDRTTERIFASKPADIFTEVNAKEYEKLIPLSAKAKLLSEEKRQIHMKPQVFKDYTKEDWKKFFDSYRHDDYYKDEYMDFDLIQSVANNCEKGESSLTLVKEYIEKQL